MIHAVTLANQHLYGRQLDHMFRMRHAYYIEGHGWSGLTSQDGRETDAFDDDSVVYLMSIDPFGNVAASVRLNPTLGPTLLKKFADWSDEPLPELDSVWDISRWIAAPQHRRASNPRWPSNHQRELMIGILEFCLSRGLTHLTMLAEHRLAERIGAYGWPLRYLGAPRAYEGGKGIAVAAEIEVGPYVLALTRAKTGVTGAQLIEIDPTRFAPSRQANPAQAAPDDVRDLAEVLGASRVAGLIGALSQAIADVGDRPRAIELVGALAQLFEAAGFPVDAEFSHKWKQPGLSTGLSHQFGTTDRA
jgi:N-acyl-L-homoserine lactone synthetase